MNHDGKYRKYESKEKERVFTKKNRELTTTPRRDYIFTFMTFSGS